MTSDRTSPRTRSWMYWGVALATLVAGFVDLAAGGITIGPVLLVVAYCVMIPMAILKG